MDYVVHINNGSDSARPIVLRLLPGEETIFNLTVVNHGEPSDISLAASDPVIKAVRFRKSGSHVDAKQIIPIFARMPANKNRLDGEIILKSGAGESRVPISLLRDSEGPGDDLGVPGMKGKGNLSGGMIRDVSDQEDANPEEDIENGEDEDVDANDDNNDNADSDDSYDDLEDADDAPFRRKKRRSEGEENEEDADEGKEPRRIVFSRDRDLQKYRSATRPRKVEDISEDSGGDVRSERGQECKGRRIDLGTGRSINDVNNNRVNDRANDRIDDRFVDRRGIQDIDDLLSPREDRYEERSEKQRAPFDFAEENHFAEENQGFQQDQDSQDQDLESLFPPEAGAAPGAAAEGQRFSDQSYPKQSYPEESYSDHGFPNQEGESFTQDDFGTFGAMQVIPAVIFLSLVVVLVLTFITYTIPEFPGALVSSILIVTLIIYGAATLLKA